MVKDTCWKRTEGTPQLRREEQRGKMTSQCPSKECSVCVLRSDSMVEKKVSF